MIHDSQTVLELRHVAFHFIKRKGYFSKQKFWAIKDVSFTLNKGECLGVIGRNGAGKTTLLQMLAGIIRPDDGVFVNHGYSTTLLSLQAGVHSVSDRPGKHHAEWPVSGAE